MFVRLVTPVPSIFIVQISRMPLKPQLNAIFWPSGDHAGALPPLYVTRTGPLPSAFMIHMSPDDWNAMRVPSGDQDGWLAARRCVSWVGPLPSAFIR